MADCIIILGGGVTPEGTIHPKCEHRVRKGTALIKEGSAAHIIMTGGYAAHLKEKPTVTEAQAMKNFAVELGVPAERILLEEHSRDTIGNALFTKLLFLEPHDWKDVIVVTSNYHVPRAQYIFEIVLGEEYDCECIGADAGLTQEEYEKRLEKEARDLEKLRLWIQKIGIERGDTERMKELLREQDIYQDDAVFSM